MGRRKMEMKRIEDKNSRQVTFSKRRRGLTKKAGELSILCDIDVALVVFSGSGKPFEYCSGNSLARILQRYHSHSNAAGKVYTDVYEAEKCASFRTSAELVQFVERHLEEPNFGHLSAADLMQLEKQLDAALIQIRSRKTQLMMESVMALHEQERMLIEENEHLEKQIIAVENNSDKANGVVLGFNLLADNYMNCDPQVSTLLLF